MAWEDGMDAGAHKGPVPSRETVENVLKDEIENIQKTNKTSTVVNMHPKPLTQDTCQGIHNAWLRKEREVEGGKKNWKQWEIKQSIVLFEFTWAKATEEEVNSRLTNLK